MLAHDPGTTKTPWSRISAGGPNARIFSATGRVFARDNRGVFAVQLDGYAGVIRVRQIVYDAAVVSRLRNCSALNPMKVTVDVGVYDITEKLFHGSLGIAEVGGVNPLVVQHTSLADATAGVSASNGSATAGVSAANGSAAAGVSAANGSAAAGVSAANGSRILKPMIIRF